MSLLALRSSRVCLPLALFLAFGAQYGFTDEIFTRNLVSNYYVWGTSQWVGCALLLAAVALCALARFSSGVSVAPATAVPPAPSRKAPPLSRRNFRWLTSSPPLAAASLFYVLSLVLFWTTGENALVRFLWLAGVMLLLVGCALPSWHHRRQTARIVFARWSRLDWLEGLAVAALTFAGFLLRYWRLTELPAHVDDDVSLMGWFSLEMLRSGDDRWFGMSGSQHPFSCNQILAWSMRLFGQDHYGLVMGSVLAGTLTLPFVYLLGRELYGRRAGFVAMALLTGSYTHIHFSRILFGPLPTLLLTAGFYFLFRGLRHRRAFSFALAGVALGFALLSYDSARVGPVIVLALFLSSFFWRGGGDDGEDIAKRRPTARQWALLAAGALLAFGPMLAFAVQDFFGFHGRGNEVVLWNPEIWQHTTEKYGTTSVLGVLAEQLRHTLLALHYYGDASPHFALEKPMVSALAAALCALGVGLALRHWRDPRCFLPLAWVAFTFFFGGVLTSDPPYWPHLNIALPAIVLLAALAAERLGHAVLHTARSRSSGALVYSVALCAVLTWSAAHNWKIYNAFARKYAGPRVRTARYLQSLPAGSRVFIVDPVVDWNVYSFRFLDRHLQGASLPPARMFETAPELGAMPTVFIVYRQPELLAFVREHYAGAGGAGRAALKERAHRDHDGNVAFTSFESNVPPRAHAGTASWSWRDEARRLACAPGWWLIGASLLFAMLMLIWGTRGRAVAASG